jgi:SulP family sulfate permease
MAIAVASGVSPERGLYTAIIGGFLVSALGGSRYQIGDPAGAFIVVSATVTQFGLSGLLLIAVALSSLATFVFHLPIETIGSRFGVFRKPCRHRSCRPSRSL